MTARIVVLPGDCIGPEVTASALQVIAQLCPEVKVEEHDIGGAAIRRTGQPLPPETLAACLTADAILKGPVGMPEYDAADVRPEQGVFALRQELGLYANLRPARNERADLVVVRELLGGLYFGQRGTRNDGTVYDTCEYHPAEVARIARVAFDLASHRRQKVTSVDKANVLETSRLWRSVVREVALDYPDVYIENMLVDNAAVQIARAPEQFDVIVTENMFGDILSDLAAGVTGGLGLAPSASVGGDGTSGLYEPVHGSAPDIAGLGIANPAAMLRSLALLLRAIRDIEQASLLETAVESALRIAPTPDMGGTSSTGEFTQVVVSLV